VASPRALLVDLDDTIISFSVHSKSSWDRVCGEFAPRFGLDPVRVGDAIGAEADSFWGDPDKEPWGRTDLPRARREFVAEAFGTLGLDRALAGEVVDRYGVVRDAAVDIYPDSAPALRALRAAGTRLVMVTNGASDPQREKINRFELAPLFDAVLVEGEFGAGKPDPSVYVEALRLADVPAEQAAMVGDNLVWDVLGAQRCGMQGIWIDRQVRGLPKDPATRPDGVVRTLEQLAREL